MLPYITGQPVKKKPTIVVSQQLIKEWAQTKKELDVKAKLSNNKIPATVISDYHKICRLKEIPQFYSNYFIVTIQKLPQQKIAECLSSEIREIINHRSHYHKISDLLEERTNLIKTTQTHIEICEGFQEMNAGKTLKSNFRTKINQVLRQATSLEQIKAVQKKSISQLANSLSEFRKNTYSILESVRSWREYLLSINAKKNKLKVMFPHNGINCILISLYDQQAIINSFLGKQFTINVQNNPFILIGKQLKRKNQFQTFFKQQLLKDTRNYEALTTQIMAQFPVKEDPNKREKQLQLQTREKQQQKIKWLKQIRQKSKAHQKLDENNKKKEDKQENELSKSKIRQKSQNKKSKSLMDIESILLKHKQKKQKKQTNKNQQLQAQIKQQGNSPKVNNKTKKIMNIYSSKPKQSTTQPDDKIKQILNEKAELQKQLKQAKTKNKEFQKLIKKIENKTTNPYANTNTNTNTNTNANTNTNPNTNMNTKVQDSTERHKRAQSNLSSIGGSKIKEEDKANFQNKIEAVYKSRHGKKISNKGPQKSLDNKGLEKSLDNKGLDKSLNNSAVSIEDLMNDRKSLEKQLKYEMRQKKSLERILKKSQAQMGKQLQNSKLQKSKLQQKIQMLQSRVNVQKKQQKVKDEQTLKRSKASIVSVYMNDNKLDNSKVTAPANNLFQSKLVEEKQKRLSLQKQIKEILKQKNKLEKTIEKSHEVIAKQKQQIERKVQKYEETIQKLKQQHSQLKSKKQSNDDEPLRKKSQSLRMYTTTPLKQKLEEKKQSSVKKTISHVQSANYFKLPPQIKKNSKQKTIIDQEEVEDKKQIVSSRQLNKVQIIQTKKTIQIIYEASRRSKKKKSQNQQPEQKQILNNEEIQKIKRQKQNLLFQLQREEAKRLKQEKAKERKMIKEEGQLQKYKQIIEKQRQRKYELENKIKNLKKQLYEEFEERLKNEKMKFQEQKRELMIMVETEKGQKQLKQKYLNNQIKFLKQMQANQNQLIKLLQNEKKGRLEKEKQLAAQISKKEQLLQLLQIQEIKKGLQSQIRQELQNNYDSEDEEQVDLEQKKDQLKRQIQQMNEQRNMELEQIDQQNQKLKALITRIKDEESKLITAIKENIEEDSQDQDGMRVDQVNSLRDKKEDDDQRGKGYHSDDYAGKYDNLSQNQQAASDIQITNLQKSKLSKKRQKQQPIDLEQAQRIFKSRLRNQQQHEKNMKNEFKKIKQSPQYKDKQEVENLIQMYLQNPHQYPPNKKRDYSPEQKKEIEVDVLKRSKLAGDFQKELMSLKEVQQFVPTADDDIMTSHLLNLKRVYEEKESYALKQQLFPSIKEQENYHDKDLSFQSEETPPPKTIRQHVELHVKKFPMKKSNNSKNFLSINKMRVAMLEQDRKQKQKQFIEDQAKRRAQNQVLKKKFRQMQEQRLKKSLQKKKLKQQKMKNEALGKGKDKKIKKKVQIKDKQKENKQGEQKDKQHKGEEQEKKEFQHLTQEQKQKIIDKQQQESEQQDLDDEEDNEQGKKQQEEEKQKEDQNDNQGQFDTDNIEITNKHSSLDREKKELESDVYRYQDEIRSFVSRQQKFDIYQQFVEATEIDNYIKNIIGISSEEIKGLNNNKTIFKDIPTYTSLLILVAKDSKKQVEVGIGIFHKEYQQSLYVCDYVIAHNMRNFLNLIFNFSRYMFKIDIFTNKIEYFFDLNKLEDQISVIHFIEFEEKCKRMGEVYVKIGSDKTRKYALRRNLFQPADKQFEAEGEGLKFQVSLQIHNDLIRQRGYGFTNTKDIEYFSTNVLLSMYMKKNQQTLAVFRKNTEDNMKYRQLLLTTLMLQKKEVDIKNCQTRQFSIEQRLQNARKLHNSFTIQDPTHGIQQLKLNIQHALPIKTKRCTFQIQEQQTNYIILFPQQAITKIQSSNSSQTGIFLNLLPKYKLLIIEATQFLTMNKVNPQINTFFYIKHFIKNIVDVQKDQHSRVFIPEVNFKNQVFLKDLSDQIKLGVFGKESLKFGWCNLFNNSLIFTPTHKDLVIKKPFIISILSGVVERVIEGTPLCATLVQ